ncbi:MAG: M1 family peptidase, partial [Tissierellales bacterium]
YHVYGEEQAENYYQYHCQMPYEYATYYLDLNAGIKKSLDQFNGWDDYGFLVYTKGAVFLNSIKEDFGMDTLCDILSSYYKTYRFHNTSTEDFIKICEKVTSTSFQERANEWIYHQ